MAQVMQNNPNGLEGPTYHDKEAGRVLAELAVDAEKGLTSGEAQARLEKHGPNVLPKAAGEGPLVLLWRQINNPLIWVLIGSAVVAMAVDPGDGIKNGLVILAVVIINTLIGFAQEFKAGKAIEALGDMVPENATVIRDGAKVVVPVASLVPGDLVLLASGDKVPADLRMVAVKNLQVEEAALTGESVPVEKSLAEVKADAGLGDRTNLAFNGTLVTYGTGTGVVVQTGARTELGRISTLLKEAADLQTPLTKALERVGKQLTVAIIAVAVAMLIVGTAREMIANGIPFVDALRGTVIFAVALAVGAIPEGLPAIVTIALSIGVQRMASRKAIVRKLPAVETLGSTTVICSDKTGTLTRNEMTVQALWTPSATYELTGVGYDPKGQVMVQGSPVSSLSPDARALLEAGALCNDSTLDLSSGTAAISGDPTEAAMVVAAEKVGIQVPALRSQQPRVDVIPFESENQFMGTLHRNPMGEKEIIIKGAPEVVLNRCEATPDLRERVLAAVDSLAAQGMRVLAVAVKDVEASKEELVMADVEGEMSFLGLQGMIDPPRPEAIEAVKACKGAGITVKMITGDHKGTAIAIGRQLGIAGPESQPVTGAAIAAVSDAELVEVATSSNVFARVAPEHKLRLVKAIQSKNNVVAMTGDGVNDAPALKQSNIGVAMGITGTAVSKEAADIVLTDDNFASIAAAVEEGRRVYDNLIKSLAFVLPTNMGLALILVAAVAFFPFDPVTKQLLLPLAPAQLLWINLVGAVALATPLAFESKEPNVMNRPPRSPDEPIMSRFVVTRTVIAAILMTLGCIGLFLWEHSSAMAAFQSGGVTAAEKALALSKAQTMAVTTVIMFQIFYMLNCRSLKDSVFKIGLWSNPTVYMGIAAILILQALFIYTPPFQQVFSTAYLSPTDWLVAALVGAVILPVVSLEKVWRKSREAAA